MNYDPETPLPESDLTDPVDESLQPAPVEVEVVKSTRRKWAHNAQNNLVVMTDENGSTQFDLSVISPANAAYLMAFGFTIYAGRCDDPNDAFERLVSPEVVGAKKPGRQPKVDHWRQAIALAYMDATKKAPNGQMGLEAATAKAASLDKPTLARLKLDVAVVRHYNKLTGGQIGYSVAQHLADEAAAA